VPAILMERNIDFNRIALIDVTESLSFHGAAIAFAMAGYEVWSFVWAAVIRSVLGVVVVYSISSWRPALCFNFDSIRGLLRFGLPYQGNNILAFIKDAVTPVFVGSYAGAAAVGYVNWARNFAFAPLMISEVFGKVAFPSFSRIQGDRELLARTVERSIRMMTVVLIPVTALMVALGPQLIHVLFTDKWLPALPAYYFYCTSPLVIGFMLPMHSALLSLGRSLMLFKVMLLLIAFEWGFGSLFVVLYGYNGIAFNQPIIALIFTLLYKKALNSEGVNVSVVKNTLSQVEASLVSGTVVWFVINQLAPTILNLLLTVVIGIFIYLLGLLMINKRIINEFIEYILQVFSVKQA